MEAAVTAGHFTRTVGGHLLLVSERSLLLQKQNQSKCPTKMNSKFLMKGMCDQITNFSL